MIWYDVYDTHTHTHSSWSDIFSPFQLLQIILWISGCHCFPFCERAVSAWDRCKPHVNPAETLTSHWAKQEENVILKLTIAEHSLHGKKNWEPFVQKQKFYLNWVSASVLSRGARRVLCGHLLSNSGCAEEEVAALSRSYRLYCPYKSHAGWMLRYSLQHGLTAWAWNWKTKVKYRDYYWALHDHF